MNRDFRNRLQLASAGIAAIGGVTALSRSRRSSRPPAINYLGGVQHRVSLAGSDLFVTELGSGPPLLLIHGIYAGASSYEFRFVAPLLAESHKVIAFDFLGCGLSDHPKLDYTAELCIAQIAHVIRRTTNEPVALVGSSYGAAFAIRSAAELGERISSVTAISPAGMLRPGEAIPRWRGISETALRAPFVGAAGYALLTSDASIRAFLRRVYSDDRMITPQTSAQYAAVAQSPGARRLIAAFVGGKLDCDLTADLSFLETAISIIRGSGPHIGADDTDTIVALGNNVTYTTLEGCGALCHEERPQASVDAIRACIARSR